MNRFLEDVKVFHKKYEVPMLEVGQRELPPFPIMKYRVFFLVEELFELFKASKEVDKAEVADALVDVVWVALGTVLMAGIDFDKHWNEVVRANMEKELADSLEDTRASRYTPREIVKPEGWVPPDHNTILDESGAR